MNLLAGAWCPGFFMEIEKMTTQELATALRDMASLADEVETETGEMVAIDVYLDQSNIYVIASTGEQFRVSVVRIA